MIASETIVVILCCACFAALLWVSFLLEGVKEEEDRKDFVEQRMRSIREAEEKKRRRQSGQSLHEITKKG